MLELRNVSKVVGGATHIRDVSLALQHGSLNVLLGPTLSGKTSLMRLMAGLDAPTSGSVWFDGANVTGVPVQKRNVAMVYQQFAKTPQEAMDSLCAEQEKVLERLERAGVQGDIGPKLAEEHDLAYWNADAVAKGNLAPQLKIENEKEKPITVNYDELVKSWQK